MDFMKGSLPMNLHFNLALTLTFPEVLPEHAFSIRMMPKQNDYQESSNTQWQIAQCSNPAITADGFDNHIIYGRIDEPSNQLAIQMQGNLLIKQPYGQEQDDLHLAGLYVVPTELMLWSDDFLDFMEESELMSISDKTECAYAYNRFVHQHIKQQEGMSLEEQSVDKLLENRKGYPQDAAHLLITMLRFQEIPARFVSGYNLEENELMYWVEALLDNRWVGLDPVHNRKIAKEPYVKIAHGRDVRDCQFHHGLSPDLAAKVQIGLQLQHQSTPA